MGVASPHKPARTRSRSPASSDVILAIVFGIVATFGSILSGVAVDFFDGVRDDEWYNDSDACRTWLHQARLLYDKSTADCFDSTIYDRVGRDGGFPNKPLPQNWIESHELARSVFPELRAVSVHAYGLPFRAAEALVVDDGQSLQWDSDGGLSAVPIVLRGIMLRQSHLGILGLEESCVLPTYPRLLPLALDFLTWSIAGWLCWVLGRNVLWKHRTRHGLCPRCGYMLWTSRVERCPECGWCFRVPC